MRDPAGNAQRYADYFAFEDARTRARAQDQEVLDTNQRVRVAQAACQDAQQYVIRQFGAGMPLPQLSQSLMQRMAQLEAATRFIHEQDREGYPELGCAAPVSGNARLGVGFAALALTLLPSPQAPAALAALISTLPHTRSYLFDVLIKAFVPDYALLKKYKADKYQAVWIDPVLRAIALPPERRAGALAAHMKNWCRLMRPWGWKPQLDTAPGKDALFCDFAFEVALAVCAFDIDDVMFKDHPYYPRELVDHYRQQVRQSRDAWRAEGAGPQVTVVAPPPPAKADLAKSKRKGVARWIELACDGDVDATESVLEAVGNPRKLNNIRAVLEALAAEQQAICADLRDDTTVEASCCGLAEARGMARFDAPAAPSSGLPRCIAILKAFAHWLPGQGYALVDLQLGDDAWALLVVRDAYCEQLLEIGKTLGMPVQQ